MCSVLAANSDTAMSTATASTKVNSKPSCSKMTATATTPKRSPIVNNNSEDEEDEAAMSEGSVNEDLSVGSPTSDPVAQNGNSKTGSTSTTTTTAALRVFRGTKRSKPSKESSEENSDNEEAATSNSETEDPSSAPLDFTTKSKTKKNEDYFLPFKKLEMANSPPSPNSVESPNNKGNNSPPPPVSQNNKNNSNSNNKKKGVAGFSIDDILSHKTALLKEQQREQDQHHHHHPQHVIHVPQAIVRPWDIGSVGGHPAAAAAVLAAQQQQLKQHQEQLKQQQQQQQQKNGNNGDSPLDALFQMASKTFEGLKAKSGRGKQFNLI